MGKAGFAHTWLIYSKFKKILLKSFDVFVLLIESALLQTGTNGFVSFICPSCFFGELHLDV